MSSLHLRLKTTRELFPLKAASLAERVPPRCISGRWLSVSEYERNILQAGASPEEQCRTWSEILTRALVRKDRKRPQKPDKLVQPVDEPRVEEMQAFSEKMGRWSRETVAGISDLLLWHVVGCGIRVEAPLTI